MTDNQMSSLPLQSADFQRFADLLDRELQKTLPGLAAQLEMVPDPRPGDKTYMEVKGSCPEAGVLILFYPFQEKIHLVLTKRTEKMKLHQAQISFPGGRLEPGESYEQAAIREAEEELGILRDRIHVIGRITPLYIPPSNFCIFPVLASVAERPDFKPAPDEVAEVIEISLDRLIHPSTIKREEWTIRGMTVSVPFYAFQENKIWGATAMVLSELTEIIRRLLPVNNA